MTQCPPLSHGSCDLAGTAELAMTRVARVLLGGFRARLIVGSVVLVAELLLAWPSTWQGWVGSGVGAVIAMTFPLSIIAWIVDAILAVNFEWGSPSGVVVRDGVFFGVCAVAFLICSARIRSLSSTHHPAPILRSDNTTSAPNHRQIHPNRPHRRRRRQQLQLPSRPHQQR